uniref:Uncharacterized protein n=1 Tax=Arundo donax TaxID=35708 RepID=A0A0A9FGB4_ARUDO
MDCGELRSARAETMGKVSSLRVDWGRGRGKVRR